MRTLVTGASGFIGSAVVRKLLARGREVRCLVEPGAKLDNLAGLDVEVLHGDITDPASIRPAFHGVERLFHLAAIYAIWHPHPLLLYKVNVEGTANVLLEALRAGVQRVVHTSSIAAVGWRPDRPSNEDDAWDEWLTGADYERSKWLSERIALGFAQSGMALTVVNPGFPFGERDIGPTPTGQALVDLLKGRILGYPPGGLSVIDVEDVAEGHLLAMEKGRAGARYILSNHNVTYGDFYRVAAQVAGTKVPTRKVPMWILRRVGRYYDRRADRTGKRPVMTEKALMYASRDVFFDNTRARTELGLPVTPLADTLARAIEWFRAYGYV